MDESGSKVEGKSFGGENEMRRQRREEQNGMIGNGLKGKMVILLILLLVSPTGIIMSLGPFLIHEFKETCLRTVF